MFSPYLFIKFYTVEVSAIYANLTMKTLPNNYFIKDFEYISSIANLINFIIK